MAYFSNFPKIDYSNSTSRNIILKAALVRSVIENNSVFYNYIIKEGQRADMVADEVYGNPTLDWVVYLSNDMVDPFYDWPLDSSNFKRYLEKKYSKTIFELQNQTSHYKYVGLTNESAVDIAKKSYKMTTLTYNSLPSVDRSGWALVSVYDYEDELNEDKRSIRLLAPIYLNQISKELSEIFNS